MNGIFVLVCFLFGGQCEVIVKNVECINVAGTEKNPDDHNSTATCPSTHILTGCGSVPTIGNNNSQIAGTSIENGNQCRTWTHYNTDSADDDFPRAYARCCDFGEYGSSFISTHWSEESEPNKDAPTSVSCEEANEILIGCVGLSYGPRFDGAFAGNGDQNATDTQNTCNAFNGQNTYREKWADRYYYDRGSWAVARCADTSLINDGYDLQCTQVWADSSLSAAISTVSCPTDFFMTSCSAYDPDQAFGLYVIENDVCTVTDGLASAIWYVCANMRIRLYMTLMYIQLSIEQNNIG